MRIALVIVNLSLISKALSVSLVFDANLRIISAYVDEKERLQLQSDVAAMESEQDYRKVMTRMREDARRLHVTLRRGSENF